MNFYKNHYGMIISSVVAYFISLLMATCAIFVDHLTFSIPLLVKNWGTAFLVISVSGMVFPLTNWSFALGRRLGLKPETLPHVLLENFIATMVFNTTATLSLQVSISTEIQPLKLLSLPVPPQVLQPFT